MSKVQHHRTESAMDADTGVGAVGAVSDCMGDCSLAEGGGCEGRGM